MKLSFRKYGTGPPLLILHGLYGSSDNWNTIARQLASEYMVFVPDLRNHGMSPHSKLHDYRQMSNDIEEFATDNIGAPFIIIGHSMGGKTAMTYALTNPAMLTAMVIADISPFTRDGESVPVLHTHRKILRIILGINLYKHHSRESLNSELTEQTGDKRIASLLMKNLKRTGKDGFTWKLNATALYNNIDRLIGTIPSATDADKCVEGFPVLFIRGGNSDYLPESHIPYIMRLFPAAVFKTIEGAGHWLHAEKPEIFIETVRDFLKGNY